jgi:murein peptide amidase A
MRAWFFGFLACTLLWTWGCQYVRERRAIEPSARPSHAGAIEHDPGRERIEPLARRVRVDVPEGQPFLAGWSVENRPIHYVVHGRGPAVMLILATIHGNEPAGTPLVEQLGRHLGENPSWLEGRTVVLVALANPDGFAHHTRWNARGVDLNRNYPTANFRSSLRNGPDPLSEPESRVIVDLLRSLRPCRVLSIHQPLSCIDHDGPAEALALAMKRHTNLPVKKLGARPGSLGSYAGLELGIPIITLELPSEATGLEPGRVWQRHGPAVLAFIAHPLS